MIYILPLLATSAQAIQPGQPASAPLPLHDLQLPEAISWWPLAPGWWALLVMVLILLFTLAYFTRNWWRNNQDKRNAQQLLKSAYAQWQANQNQQQLIMQFNSVLKRYCRNRFPQAISLSGEQWTDFLNRSAATSLFSGIEAEALQSGAYRADALPSLAAQELFKNCQRWLQKAKATNIRETH